MALKTPIGTGELNTLYWDEHMHVQRNGKSRILPGNDGALEALNFI